MSDQVTVVIVCMYHIGLIDGMTLTAVKVILSVRHIRISIKLFDNLRLGGVPAKYYQQKGHKS